MGDTEKAADLTAKLESNLLHQKIKEIPEVSLQKGRAKATRIELDDGTQAVKKKPVPMYGMSPNAEVAAFRLDQYLGGKAHVPVTVKRFIDGQEYSLQYFLKNAIESEITDHSSYEKCLEFFDFLIDNIDRKKVNLLRLEDGTYVAIDNGFSFNAEFLKRNGSRFGVQRGNEWSLMLSHKCYEMDRSGFSEKCVEKFILNSLPPKDLYEKVKNTPPSMFRQLFSDLLPESEIEAFLRRRDLFVQTTEKWLSSGHEYPNI